MNLYPLQVIAQTSYPTATNQATADRADGAKTAFTEFLSQLPFWIAAICILIFFFFLARYLSNKAVDVIMRKQKEMGTHDQHKNIMIVTRRLTFYFTFILGVVVALAVADLLKDMGWLLGSVGLAIGFALRGFIANFVSGIFLLVQERTKLGNYVEVDGIKGIIREIGIRATVIQTFQGVEILVPNETFFNNAVIIYTSNPVRRLEIPVGVDYGTDLTKAVDVILEVIKQHKDILQDHPQDVLVKEFANSSINLLARFWVNSKSTWWMTESDIVKAIKQAFDANSITIPFPHRTLKLDHSDPAWVDLIKRAKGDA